MQNIIEYEVYGDYALFSEPGMRIGGEKTSYHLPTYEAIKGITESIYWKPSIKWIVDSVRIMNPIQTETRGVLLQKYGGGKDLAYYTYLKNVRYQVRAHLEINGNYPELKADWNEGKHYNIAQRMVKRGGRRDIFLGTRECQGFVVPCVFGEDRSFYDNMPGEVSYGFMYHGITYPNEAVLPEDKWKMTLNFWNAVMKTKGILEFPKPEKCPRRRVIKKMEPTPFGKGTFSGLMEFTDEEA
ncbi:type I-C CRISPR-associated protein Cas5c [Ruminococcus turbiniformis]